MQAMVGQEAPFDHGRERRKVLAGLEVTTQAVGRSAEAIGEDIGRYDQQEIQRAVQLDLPIVIGEPVPILYVQMDGTGVPMVKKESQTAWDAEGFTIRDPDSTTYVGAIETAEEFGKRLYVETWKRGGSRANEGRHERRGGVDLESCGATLSRRRPDCRSLPCPPPPVGVGP